MATVDVQASPSEPPVMTRDGIGLTWPMGWYALQHYDDPDLIFEHKPTPDPLKNGKVNANTHPKEFEAWKEWANKADAFEKSLMLPAETGYRFVRACKNAGYRSRNGRLAYWLVDYMGRQLKAGHR